MRNVSPKIIDYKCSTSWFFLTTYLENTISNYSVGLSVDIIQNDFDEIFKYYTIHKKS
ncbi:PoNe immunity protein domain-containing protein [Vibrio spartinae]|uniref:PoNe immunity protein domain-containing protein n=1 Tax=Vibrio spartinae TaxID=1918945 RepID=UPI00351FC3A0